MSEPVAVACILGLTRLNFYYCYLYDDGKIHDSYKVVPYRYEDEDDCKQEDDIFVKLCITAANKVVIARFHCDNGGM